MTSPTTNGHGANALPLIDMPVSFATLLSDSEATNTSSKLSKGAPFVSRLLELVAYEPSTGYFTWRKSFSNGVAIGDLAGRTSAKGYVIVKLDQVQYRAHRLAWLYTNGAWPVGEIDHINGIRSDNRLVNLRDVPRSVNAQNRRFARGRIGHLGVCARPESKRKPFMAKISADHMSIYLGLFETAESAHAAYVIAKRRLHEGCTL